MKRCAMAAAESRLLPQQQRPQQRLSKRPRQRPLPRMLATSFLLTTTLLLVSPLALATTITLNILDAPGEGFNDNTAVDAVGGNNGATRGAQRQLALQFAADLLATVIDSPVTITVDARFDPLPCSASSATLGHAGPNSVHFGSFFEPLSLPVPNTYYVQAQANHHEGIDLNALSDIDTAFNSSVDNNNNCLNGKNWYYGLDGNGPGNSVDFLSTALHEILHGLGLLTLVDLSTGTRFNNRDDIFMRQLEDHSLAKTWQELSNAQRSNSATDDPDLHWTGAAVQSQIATLTAGTAQGHIRMHAPASLSAGSSVSHFSSGLAPFELMEPILEQAVDSIGLAKAALQDIGWTTSSNSAPTISPPTTSPLMLTNAVPQTVSFAVLDNDDEAENLAISATSSAPEIIANNGLQLGGNGRLRTLTITPLSAAAGNVTIALNISDNSNNSNNLSFNVDVASNLPPVLSIDTPPTGQLFLSAPQAFSATASDPESGDISTQIQWLSSLDGAIGSGGVIQATLSDGEHEITATVTDGEGNSRNANVAVTVSLAGDEDGDGLSNALEVALGTDPFDNDSDDDFLWDFDEVNRDGDPSSYDPSIDTNPIDSDSDDDGQLDGVDMEPLTPGVEEVNVPALPLWSLWLLAGALTLIGRRR